MPFIYGTNMASFRQPIAEHLKKNKYIVLILFICSQTDA